MCSGTGVFHIPKITKSYKLIRVNQISKAYTGSHPLQYYYNMLFYPICESLIWLKFTDTNSVWFNHIYTQGKWLGAVGARKINRKTGLSKSMNTNKRNQLHPAWVLQAEHYGNCSISQNVVHKTRWATLLIATIKRQDKT